MMGIYMVINLITEEKYIGQSKNIEQRVRKYLSSTDTLLGKAIQEYGKENFLFLVLEECNEDKLDEREDFYIVHYKSNIPRFGYNILRGGQHINKYGELNINSKLTENEVYEIREAYKNHCPKYQVYEKYKNKITKSYFSNIWEGYSWKNTHMDVYTEENLNYYKYETSRGENSKFSIFTNEEVLEMRNRYVNESAKSIYESVKDRCKFETLQMILWGRYYNNIPIYDKKNKKWINN